MSHKKWIVGVGVKEKNILHQILLRVTDEKKSVDKIFIENIAVTISKNVYISIFWPNFT